MRHVVESLASMYEWSPMWIASRPRSNLDCRATDEPKSREMRYQDSLNRDTHRYRSRTAIRRGLRGLARGTRYQAQIWRDWATWLNRLRDRDARHLARDTANSISRVGQKCWKSAAQLRQRVAELGHLVKEELRLHMRAASRLRAWNRVCRLALWHRL